MKVLLSETIKSVFPKGGIASSIFQKFWRNSMNNERSYKILMATGIEGLDHGIGTMDSCNVVGICDNHDSIYDKIEELKPQIVIISDWLAGDRSVPELLIDLKRQYHYVRFIYLAGQLDPRNTERVDELGRLVLSGIYDICISKDINLEVIDNLVKNPKEESTVSYLAKNILNNQAASDFVKQESVLKGLPDAGGLVSGIMDNVYVFTSIKPGTGKSFLSVNCACAIAAYGRKNEDGEKPKVAIIEADLQTLSIGTILGIEEKKEELNKKNMKAAIEAISTLFDRGNLIGDDNEVMLVNKVLKNCMEPYSKLDNLHIMQGSMLTPEEIDSLNVSPEYYIYLLDVIRKDYDVVIVDTNSSMFHITTYPLLQKARECYYIVNLDPNNIRNNARYYDTLRKLNLLDKIRWVMNENVENTKAYKDQGVLKEEVIFTADDFEREYFKLTSRIPVVDKSVFLNRNYVGVPIVLDQDIQYTRGAKEAILDLANNIYPIDKEPETKKKEKKGGLFGLFGSKPKAPKEPKPKKEKVKKSKRKKNEEDEDDE